MSPVALEYTVEFMLDFAYLMPFQMSNSKVLRLDCFTFLSQLCLGDSWNLRIALAVFILPFISQQDAVAYI